MEKNSILQAVSEYAEDHLPQRLHRRMFNYDENFVPGTTHIPATYPELFPEDVANLVDTVLSFWYTEGKASAKFSKLLEEITKTTNVTLVNSGSSANLLAITAAKKWYNDQPDAHEPAKFVITCATGFPTTVAPIYQNSLIPIYIDINKDTLQPDHYEFELAMEKFGNQIGGSILAHTLGFPYYEYDFISDKFLIADCCDALGGGFHTGFPVGDGADISTYSFFPAHQIMTAEGGAVATRNEELSKIIDSLSNWGRSCYCQPGQENVCGQRFTWPDLGKMPEGWDHKYLYDYLGYNFKMTEFQAALGYTQLSRLSEIVRLRTRHFESLSGFIEHDCADILKTVTLDAESNHPSPFGFPIYCNTPEQTNRLISHLEAHKIHTRRVFAGNITKQPAFMNLPYLRLGDLNGSDYVMNHVFWIGCYPQLSMNAMDYIQEVLKDWCKGEKK